MARIAKFSAYTLCQGRCRDFAFDDYEEVISRLTCFPYTESRLGQGFEVESFDPSVSSVGNWKSPSRGDKGIVVGQRNNISTWSRRTAQGGC